MVEVMQDPRVVSPRSTVTGMLSRRIFIGSAMACVACSERSIGAGAEGSHGPLVPLSSVARFPIGGALNSADLNDPTLMALFKANFSQVTPGYEMKMGPIVRTSGQFDYTQADLVADYAAANNMALHGHTLVWYKSEPEAFKRIEGDRIAFAALYKRYITETVTHYRNRARGWDVVNEPVTHDGTGLRDCLWSRVLGAEDYMVDAFDHAHRAAPESRRFINDYGLEEPGKRRLFMALVERLLKRGAKLNGIGTQTHVKIDLPTGALTDTIKDLASFGLPVHVSELDISYGHRSVDLRTAATKSALQADRAAELVRAYAKLPEKQQYAITIWGVRDRDSWLRHDPFPTTGDAPLLFDDDGQPKPMLHAMLDAFRETARR
ncbi:endo-1,4-beta-xylanase [Sphingomonas sp.]|uniref:endo-1,4-beta-xylanase n=1 Tax=Sphingomonas sp. TaxID=28214 RepID=UPI0025D48BCA|nr:endo-1,4-beta-xylanase [Sphingomonas sp.]